MAANNLSLDWQTHLSPPSFLLYPPKDFTSFGSLKQKLPEVDWEKQKQGETPVTTFSVLVYRPPTLIASATNQMIVEAVEAALLNAIPPRTAHTLNIKVFTADFDYGAGNYHHVSIDIRSNNPELFPTDQRAGIREEISRRLAPVPIEVAFFELDLG